MAISAGPLFKFNPSMSFIVNFDPLLFAPSPSREKDAREKIDVGVPVVTALPGDERVSAGKLPAGRYASLIYTGHGLTGNKALIEWAKAKGIAFEPPATAAEIEAAALRWYSCLFTLRLSPKTFRPRLLWKKK